MELQAYAKLNITLDVVGKRADGYHALRSVMLAVDLCDTLIAEPATRTAVSFSGIAVPALAAGDTTVDRAIAAYSQLAGEPLTAKMQVIKRIPAQAGLGGGSADAAAALTAMQRMYGRLTNEQLFCAALKVGADVPFCLQGGACEAQGVGERLTPLIIKEPLHIVIAKPEGGVSTKALFQSLRLPVLHPDTDAAIAALQTGDIAELAGLLQNALEPAATALCPEIAGVKQRLLQAGALGTVMTGSGSAAFGLFPNRAAALAAEARLRDLPFAVAVTSVM